MRVPFNRGYLPRHISRYMMESVSSGQTAGNGVFTAKVESHLESVFTDSRVLLTTSCTHALEMAAILLDIGPGDEVIVPSFTFVSTVNAFVLRGASPVFVDVRPDTLNIDETAIEAAITNKTKAIVVVHYAGVGCEMDAIVDISERTGVPIIEDNAHGLFGAYKDKLLGSMGSFATQSFHSTKNFSCGEGGALIINDQSYADRAEIIREKGTNRSLFFQGKIDRYSWVDVGSSYVMSDILASMLLAQLEETQWIQATRKRSWWFYYDQLEDWCLANKVVRPTVPAHCDQAYHMFYLVLPTPVARKAFIKHMSQADIDAPFHYLPLDASDFVKTQFPDLVDGCPITADLSARLVRLPLYNDIKDFELEYVVNTVQKFKV